jgi:hypothetical protein
MTGVKGDLDPRGPVPREQQICWGQQPLEQVRIKVYYVDTQQPRWTNFGRRLGKGRFRKKVCTHRDRQNTSTVSSTNCGGTDNTSRASITDTAKQSHSRAEPPPKRRDYIKLMANRNSVEKGWDRIKEFTRPE